ncbi:TPA_asm: hypothetical protein G1T83_19270 [Salmonella enterica subsp. enterica serovar Typhi str. CT18]|uniref:Uncharacterized protein n=1 Tax=Salmonella enterica subsp. enterica serovar Typhi str. CT18 TaxID=220341 RepID=A0A716MTX7_SALTI|nr:hypothetical protein [Salmonella enterica subsp. enterica serovar Typhi str. CT18]HAD4311346.1 hypothetical protein [Salmonella enterica subsp. enterica serovar Typhi str. CT18]HAD4404688.1 hypothetical protein [Salmonella enterica subsp. enterica serovar Typhi str. CT18]HAD4422294.1 hypothetical protein [Salmonella enterica subsp. enterica serovar Typhi str. CT18]HAD5466450.1 hypothetical protein [Salmonella enterica subsp. enterica serovar Typhi str. CT18]
MRHGYFTRPQINSERAKWTNIAILALTFTGRDKVQALFRTTKNQTKGFVENPQRINTTDFQLPGHQITRFFYISQIKI